MKALCQGERCRNGGRTDQRIETRNLRAHTSLRARNAQGCAQDRRMDYLICFSLQHITGTSNNTRSLSCGGHGPHGNRKSVPRKVLLGFFVTMLKYGQRSRIRPTIKPVPVLYSVLPFPSPGPSPPPWVPWDAPQADAHSHLFPLAHLCPCLSLCPSTRLNVEPWSVPWTDVPCSLSHPVHPANPWCVVVMASSVCHAMFP
jgi:hypothetical protein